MGIRIEGNTSGNVAEVDASNNLDIVTPTVPAQAGYGGAQALVTSGVAYPTNAPRSTRALFTTDSGRMNLGVDSPLFYAWFPASAIDTSIWSQSTSTQTITVGSGNLNVNNSATTTASTYAIATSYRWIPYYEDSASRFDCTLQFSATPANHTTVEWGLFQCATTAAPLDGVLFRITNGGDVFAVANCNGTEQTVDLGFTVTANVRYEWAIIVDVNVAYYYVNTELAAIITAPKTTLLTNVPTQPITFRSYNDGTGGGFTKMQVSSASATLMDVGAGRYWSHAMSGMGRNSIQYPTGSGTIGSTAGFTNNSAPSTIAAASLSGTTPSYSTLGGQFAFIATAAGAETDFALFGFLNPASSATVPGATLFINSIRIDFVNLTATANATNPVIVAWYLGVGSTGASLATTEGAGTKICRRINIGNQQLNAAAAIGDPPVRGATPFNSSPPATADFSNAPLVCNPGEYVHVIVRLPISANNTTNVLRGYVYINGYWE